MCSDLKDFIVRENAKCVKEIKDSNDRRLVAVEESLSFAMDTLKAVSDRQHSADLDIVALQRETADLRRRLQQVELVEDRRQQEKRLVCLLFSGPALRSLTRPEEAAHVIRTLVQQYLGLALDRAQIRALVPLRSGKVLIEFNSAAPGSDRDILYRTKSRLRGSGLYIAESLTPRRQAMFADLLRLRKQGMIFSVFTRSGDILACRSRDSAPLRIASPEAVQQLVESGGAARPEQGRAQARGAVDAPQHSASGRDPPGRARGEDQGAPPDISNGMEVETRSPTDVLGPSRGAPPHHGALSGGTAVDSGLRGSENSANFLRSGSSLLDCARETMFQMVQLSPPLEEARPAEGAAATDRRPAGGGEFAGSPVAAVTRCETASPVCRSAVVGSPRSGGLGSPLTVTPGDRAPPQSATASGERGGRNEISVSVQSRGETGPRSSGPGPGGTVGKPGAVEGGRVSGGRDEAGVSASAGTVPRVFDDRASSGAPRQAAGVLRGAAGSRSRDIREYF